MSGSVARSGTITGRNLQGVQVVATRTWIKRVKYCTYIIFEYLIYYWADLTKSFPSQVYVCILVLFDDSLSLSVRKLICIMLVYFFYL